MKCHPFSIEISRIQILLLSQRGFSYFSQLLIFLQRKMNKTRKVISYFILAVIIITSAVFFEVKKFAVAPEIENDAMEMYGRVVYFDNFPKEKLFLGTEIENLRNSVIPYEI